ncbi:hypothetical protein ACUR5C_03860 [Aliikangiella sp. IMCC44653]
MKLLYPLSLVLVLFLSACEEQGPAEKAGEKVDEIAKDVGNEIEDACEKVKDTVDAKDKDC